MKNNKPTRRQILKTAGHYSLLTGITGGITYLACKGRVNTTSAKDQNCQQPCSSCPQRKACLG